MKRISIMLLQCTWGLAQTLMGAIVFLATFHFPHRLYRGCIDTRWNLDSGLSLGLFIFTPREETRQIDRLRVHEYGHCIQSMVLGPLYLIVCIISFTWARLPYFRKLRREKRIRYTACFVESWASRWGEWVTGEEAIWH